MALPSCCSHVTLCLGVEATAVCFMSFYICKFYGEEMIGSPISNRFRQRFAVFIFLLFFLGDTLSWGGRHAGFFLAIPFSSIGQILVLLILGSISVIWIWRTVIHPIGWAILMSLALLISAAAVRVLTSLVGEITDYLTIARYLVFFGVGAVIGAVPVPAKLRRISVGSLIAILIAVLTFTDWNSMEFATMQNSFNYLRLADNLVVVALAAICLSRHFYSAVPLFVMSVLALFIVNSRFALAGFIVVGLTLLLIVHGSKSLVLLPILVAVLWFLFKGTGLSDILVQTRVFRLLLSPNADSSLAVRRDLLRMGWDSLRSSWFVGDFKGQLRNGSYGWYIHNGLAYWRQYGLMAFTALSGLVVSSILYILRYKWSYARLSNWQVFSVGYFVYTVLGLIFAKSHVYTGFYVAVGLVFSSLQTSANNGVTTIRHSCDEVLSGGV